MRNLEKRLRVLEQYKTMTSEYPEIIYIEEGYSKITGMTLCHAAAGGELVKRLDGETIQDLKDRCQALDKQYRRENRLHGYTANSIGFAEYD